MCQSCLLEYVHAWYYGCDMHNEGSSVIVKMNLSDTTRSGTSEKITPIPVVYQIDVIKLMIWYRSSYSYLESCIISLVQNQIW